MRKINRYLSCVFFLLFISQAHAGITLHDVSGEKIPFSTLQGKWVLINYWASWCKSCIDEIPVLNQFYDKYKHDDVAVFAVNYDALPTDMQKQLIKQFGIKYPSLKKDPASALKLGHIRAVPVTFVFNPKGELTDALYGGQTLNSLKEALVVN
jgi:thiol-disulfide isomerase/thioredoxin